MARADLLISLVRSSSEGDTQLFRRTLEAIIAEERRKHHHVLADRLSEYLARNGRPSRAKATPLVDAPEVQKLLLKVTPRRTLADLVLPQIVRRTCAEVVEEFQRRELLRSEGLEPRHRVLTVGPPGNGKTSLAGALAEALMLPLFVVRYEAVIGSYLGETATRLRRVFDFVRSRECVLFFDEFDTVGKERGDEHETGEIKRVVSSLLMQVDDLPSHVMVVTATNHPELLDRAVWRRFQVRLHLPRPDESALREWFTSLQERLGSKLVPSPLQIARALKGISFAEAEDFSLDIRRRLALADPAEANMKAIVSGRLEQWQDRGEASDR